MVANGDHGGNVGVFEGGWLRQVLDVFVQLQFDLHVEVIDDVLVACQHVWVATELPLDHFHEVFAFFVLVQQLFLFFRHFLEVNATIFRQIYFVPIAEERKALDDHLLISKESLVSFLPHCVETLHLIELLVTGEDAEFF